MKFIAIIVLAAFFLRAFTLLAWFVQTKDRCMVFGPVTLAGQPVALMMQLCQGALLVPTLDTQDTPILVK